MSRLKALTPMLTQLSPTIAYLPQGASEQERFRKSRAPGHKWYSLARWKRLRSAILLRDHYTCRTCGRLEHDTSKLVVDHRQPHKGNELLFWDEQNLQVLCSPCHSGAKQREERQGGGSVFGTVRR